MCAAQCLRLGPLFLPVTIRQLLFYLLCAVLVLLFLFWNWKPAYTVLTFIICGSYGLAILFRLCSVGLSVLRWLVGRPCEQQVAAAELQALDRAALPVYTILVPMYKEKEVAGKIARAVTQLDYPVDKLDVKLLLEEDDAETRACVAEVMETLPPCVEVVVCPKVPPGEPRTKPRACNWGLERARGEFLVIYDAEDHPEPDQLLKAVAVFRRLQGAGRNRAICLQAKLNYFNVRHNLLTRFFTLEYTNWFDLFLPGLHAFRTPIPLGGTSNHFRTDVLKKLGGWDPFNVTEDCDLGIRLARQGYETDVLDSTTWEEATSRLGPWIRQRSRWIKGYFQTHLVHTRESFLPPFFLAALFGLLAHLCHKDVDNMALDDWRRHASQFTFYLSVALLAASGALGVWALLERGYRRAKGQATEGSLGLWHALTFRLTVGGMSAMLVLNLVFWCLSGAYLFRKPLARALPDTIANRSLEALDNQTPRQLLEGWELYYTNVTDERYETSTIWSTLKQWLKREITWSEALTIIGYVDSWSFWSQILYPVVIGLFLANLVFVLLGMVACGKRRLWDLLPLALVVPFYWVLISLGALKGAWQLWWNPWYWEKTPHGFVAPPEGLGVTKRM